MNLSKTLKYSIVLISIYQLCIGCQNNKYNCPIQKSEIARNDSIINTKTVKQFQNSLKEVFKEPILQNNKNESYRITVFNAFGAIKSIFRIRKNIDSYTVVYKKISSILDNQSNFIDSTMVTKQTQITKTEWNQIVTIINKNCFWTMPTSLKKVKIVKDGAVYIIEGNKPNKKNPTHKPYHLIHRNTPKESSFKTICDELSEFVYYKIYPKN